MSCVDGGCRPGDSPRAHTLPLRAATRREATVGPVSHAAAAVRCLAPGRPLPSAHPSLVWGFGRGLCCAAALPDAGCAPAAGSGPELDAVADLDSPDHRPESSSDVSTLLMAGPEQAAGELLSGPTRTGQVGHRDVDRRWPDSSPEG